MSVLPDVRINPSSGDLHELCCPDVYHQSPRYIKIFFPTKNFSFYEKYVFLIHESMKWIYRISYVYFSVFVQPTISLFKLTGKQMVKKDTHLHSLTKQHSIHIHTNKRPISRFTYKVMYLWGSVNHCAEDDSRLKALQIRKKLVTSAKNSVLQYLSLSLSQPFNFLLASHIIHYTLTP